MKLVFVRSNGDEVKLADVKSIAGAGDVINDFLKQHNYKSYYTRRWYDEEEGCVWFDVGSHTEFFKLYDEE